MLLWSKHGKPSPELDTDRESEESNRRIQESEEANPPKEWSKSTILIEGFKLETPRLQQQQQQPKSPPKQQRQQQQRQTRGQDVWQHPPQIQLIQLPDETTTTDSPDDSILDDPYLLYKDAPDNYFLKNLFEPENTSKIHSSKAHQTETVNTTENPENSENKNTQTQNEKPQHETNTSATQTNIELPPDTPSHQEEQTPQTQQSEAQAPPEIPNTSLLSVEDVTQHLTIDAKTNIPYIPLSTTLTLKRKRHMFYFPMDFENFTLDGLVDTGALTSAISEADLNKIKLLANDAIKDTGPAPNSQIMVANGQLEIPIGTVLLEFEVADFQFKENFIIMKVLPNPLIGLCFLQRNNAILMSGKEY